MKSPLKATLDAELTDDRVRLVLRVGGSVVWEKSVATEAWHHEVVDMIIAKTVRQKVAGFLAKGLGG